MTEINNSILITGNGFDLYHGLPTSYMDFMNITNKLIKKSKGETIDGLFKDVNGVIKDNFKDKDLKKLLFSFNNFWEEAENNIWFKYFNFLIDKKVIINTWIDFENEILNALILINNECELVKSNNIIKYASSYQNNLEKEIGEKFFFKEKEYVTGVEESLINLNFYFKKDNFNFICHKYNKYSGNNFLKFQIDSYIQDLFKELNNFEKCFISYLDVFVNPLIKIDKIKSSLSFIMNSNYFFLKHYNFNYTSTISIYQNANYSSVTHKDFISKNLHGKIEKNNIIFGIDDVDSIKYDKDKYLIFTKYYRRLVERCDDSKAFIDIENNDAIKKVVIFGHSLDKSDKTYFEQLLNLIYNKRKDKMKKVELVIYWHNILSQSNQIKNLIEIFGRERIEEMFRLNIINLIEIEK